MNGDVKNVGAAVYPVVCKGVGCFMAVVCDEERIPTPAAAAMRAARESSDILAPTFLKVDDYVDVSLGGDGDLVLRVSLVRVHGG